MGRREISGAIALGCLGVVLIYVGWLGLRGEPAPIACGDSTCTEAHP